MKGELYCKYNITEVKSSASSLKKNTKQKNGVDEAFICPQWKQENTPDNETTYCDSCNVMTTSDCHSNKIKSEFIVQNIEQQVLIDLKHHLTYLKMVLMKLWKNIIKGKTAFAKGILKKERKKEKYLIQKSR